MMAQLMLGHVHGCSVWLGHLGDVTRFVRQAMLRWTLEASNLQYVVYAAPCIFAQAPAGSLATHSLPIGA